ncbi:hypothetical protein CRG98_006935 [Punica granatum]|uniref:Uncharacterized protein n=1 Tax=Punica granatum TaxID=22663 RepID=A0A2I0KW34_PUNGR|nr:hypothetical protein CRG98_006935 [Punica granatum]
MSDDSESHKSLKKGVEKLKDVEKGDNAGKKVDIPNHVSRKTLGVSELRGGLLSMGRADHFTYVSDSHRRLCGYMASEARLSIPYY